MKRRRMYAVSLEGVGLIAGTLAYSRREAIRQFQGSNRINSADWNEAKHAGYRTVQALVEVITKYGRRRSKIWRT